MTDRVLRGLEVDVGTDDAVQIAPADDEAEHDAALVHALGVVGGPGDGVGDAGVDAQGAEERAGVLDAGLLRAEQHGEAGDAEGGDEDIAEAAAFGAVCYEPDRDGLG